MAALSANFVPDTILCVETSTIAALLSPYIELEQKLLDQTSTYIDLLLKWNARVNLTAVRDPAEIVQRHFGESFFAGAHLLKKGSQESVIDLGSGAGFPGLPIAMLRPKARVTLIESNGKKAAFLNEVIRTLKITNATVFKARAETYPGSAELVTMRAVENFSRAASLAMKLVTPGGRLALMLGASQRDPVVNLDSRITWTSPVPVPCGHSRILLVGIKSQKVE